MCGRFLFTSPEEAARATFGYASPPLNLRPNYNLSPTPPLPLSPAISDARSASTAVRL
jgi:hypothetical protein